MWELCSLISKKCTFQHLEEICVYCYAYNSDLLSCMQSKDSLYAAEICVVVTVSQLKTDKIVTVLKTLDDHLTV